MSDGIVERQDDMGQGTLRLIKQDDGDVLVVVIHYPHYNGGKLAGVEFCSSGGKSPETLKALQKLVEAMERDAGRNLKGGS